MSLNISLFFLCLHLMLFFQIKKEKNKQNIKSMIKIYGNFFSFNIK